jgi:hypothetical protein
MSAGHGWQTASAQVRERGLLRDEEFGFQRTRSRILQLIVLVERVNRNFDEMG